MPFSSKVGKDQILEWFTHNQSNIKRILDIGVGSGTYANLVKIKHNLCVDSDWVGVEAWAPYVEKYKLTSLYNQIINIDVRLVDWSSLGKFDVVIAGDILEHMTKEDAIQLVEKILDHSSMLIISIPISFSPQDEYEGNPFEIHVKPDWSDDEVKETWGQYIQNSFSNSTGNFRLGVYWLSREK